jgi:hypothetical protein
MISSGYSEKDSDSRADSYTPTEEWLILRRDDEALWDKAGATYFVCARTGAEDKSQVSRQSG